MLLSAAGKPYDTLEEVIGITGRPDDGSLRDFGVDYRQIELAGGDFDYPAVETALTELGEPGQGGVCPAVEGLSQPLHADGCADCTIR